MRRTMGKKDRGERKEKEIREELRGRRTYAILKTKLMVEKPFQDQVSFNCHVSLISFDLEQFFGLPLFLDLDILEVYKPVIL